MESIRVIIVIISFLVLSCNSQTSNPNDPCTHISPFIYVCDNGTILRDTATAPLDPVPPSSPHDPTTRVSSKDIIINQLTQVSARVYLPALPSPNQKIPILVYFHGGAFCIGSPSSLLDHVYLNKVSSTANVLVVSVDYRRFPEYEMPVPLDDAWDALQWLALAKFTGSDPWISSHANFDKVFIGGDSAGATIVHHLSLRAGTDVLPNDVKIRGAFLAMPYFLSSRLLPLEPKAFPNQSFYKVWKYVCSLCLEGVDHPYINPAGIGAPSLSMISVEKIMVYVAEKDYLRQRGTLYGDLVVLSGWDGEIQVFEAPGEDHVFHVFRPNSTNTKILIGRLANFLEN
ncbi:hypothetical protein Dimus_010258 [Dionaea muscipula]